MGLDMTLYKTFKMRSFQSIHYDMAETLLHKITDEGGSLPDIDLKKYTNIEDANSIYQHANNQKGWWSLFKEIGYWRKAYMLHHWFVKHVQNGIDECYLTVVTKEKLEELDAVLKKIIDRPSLLEELLPYGGEFASFFARDPGYEIIQIQETIDNLKHVFEETDFEREEILYHSSW